MRESLQVALSHLAPVVRAKRATIFVAGSAAERTAKLGLDIDLFFLVDADCHQRQHLLADASHVIDIFRLGDARIVIDAMLGEDTLSATDLVGPLVGRDV